LGLVGAVVATEFVAPDERKAAARLLVVEVDLPGAGLDARVRHDASSVRSSRRARIHSGPRSVGGLGGARSPPSLDEPGDPPTGTRLRAARRHGRAWPRRRSGRRTG